MTIAVPALTPRSNVAAATADVGAKAAGGDIEIAMNLFAVGEQIPPHAKQTTGAEPAELVAADSLQVLRGDTRAMVAELNRWREEFGASYILVNVQLMDQLAPVIETLV